MRTLMAITTPQGVVNNCIEAVEGVTLQRGVPLIPGSMLDHFAFVVSTEKRHQLEAKFATRVFTAHRLEAPEVAMGLVGMQAHPSQLSWYYGNPFPALALIEEGPQLAVPAGGGYIVITMPSMTFAISVLDELQIPHERTMLYGRSALRVDGVGRRDYMVGPGVYSLYIMTDDIMSIAGF